MIPPYSSPWCVSHGPLGAPGPHPQRCAEAKPLNIFAASRGERAVTERIDRWGRGAKHGNQSSPSDQNGLVG